ncbi:MAG: class I SAM-dependent methyltransferase [Candidatus Cloacimonetes bacterium]|nr:class I SAM-dependent methyltransferase [Candidatus Cloacimonadota bacterium]
MEKQAYSLFARYYDEYMAHVDYDSWVNFVLQRYRRSHKHNPERVLELACGTGNIASRLVQRGLVVDATDISAAMLQIARTKPFAANYHQADMLEPSGISEYDIILLLFDSLNYLKHPEDIPKLLTNVSNSLKPGGMFIFDISTIRNCQENFDGFVNIEDNEQGYVIHESEFDREKLLQSNHITFFIPEGNLYQRYDEHHIQKIYTVANIIEYIKEAGLKLLGVYRLAGENSHKVFPKDYAIADDVYERLFFVVENDNA